METKDEGMRDFFVGIKGKAGDWAWNALYHDFKAESGSGGFGNEIDASLSRGFGEHLGLLFKVAWFDADESSGYDDTTKFWVQFTAKF